MEGAVETADAGSAAGVLLFRRHEAGIQVLLVHPGGPYWATKDLGAWSIPKAEPMAEEGLLDAATRDLREETGITPGDGTMVPLGVIRHRNGRTVYAWALEGDWDPGNLRSSTCSVHWPPHSPLVETFPETDRAQWFSVAEARRRILPGQIPLLEALEDANTRTAAISPDLQLCEC